MSWWFKTTRTLGRWRLLSGGGDVAVDGDVGYDDDGDGEVAVMVVLAAVGQQPERRGEKRECKITYNGNGNGWDTFGWLWVNLEWKG
ncbi:hypothetical protein Tco_1047599 [Tanacetum coccineum]